MSELEDRVQALEDMLSESLEAHRQLKVLRAENKALFEQRRVAELALKAAELRAEKDEIELVRLRREHDAARGVLVRVRQSVVDLGEALDPTPF